MKPKSPPRLRRAYFDCRYGQLHVHNAIPSGGGFDELTTLVCIHGAGQTGRVFSQILATLGADRSIYAPDLPGCGESDPAKEGAVADVGFNAIADFLESMRIRKVDVVAMDDGAVIAERLAAALPAQVRKLVLIGDARSANGGGTTQPVLWLERTQAIGRDFTTRLAEFLS